MADIDLATLTAPIEDGLPCGPDLDAEDDDAFANFMSASEMVLPDRYFVEDHEGNRRPFYTDDRFKDLNLNSNIISAGKLLVRTHDLRLSCLVAKIQIFNRKLEEFQISVETIASLLEKYWDDLHPKPESGLREGVLERLNEQYTVVTALNNAPLFRSRRFGALSWHSYLAAVREAGGDREDADTSSVDRILIEENRSDLAPIATVQATLGRLIQALARISAICLERLASGPPDLRRLSEAAIKIRGLLDRIHPPAIAQEDVSAEGEGGTATANDIRPPGRMMQFETTQAAGLALAVATRYLSESEPSSPALLLLRQAQALIGKSFLEAMNSLLPEQVGGAKLSVAALPIFNLPLRQLAEQGLAAEDAPSLDEDTDDAASADSPVPSTAPPPHIGSRAEVLAVLDRVGAHYRAVEPSSPIPLLIERAGELVGKDFMSLIRTMLSESVLRGD